MALRHAKLAGIVDLAPKGVGLTSEHTAAAIVKADAFEVVRLIVPAGTVLKQHQFRSPSRFIALKGRWGLGSSIPRSR